MRRRRFLAATGAVGAAGLASLSGCAASANADYDVGMTAVAYRPPEVTVSAGEEVVWKNTSSRGHTITAYDSGIPDGADYFASGGFESEQAARDGFWNENRSGLVTSGESYRHTFETPGEYRYFCIPHEQANMVGTVVVEK